MTSNTSPSRGASALAVAELERVTHEHKQTKAVMDQLARSAGHVTSIRRMVEEGRNCTDILVQLAAVRASIDRVSRLVLEDHIESCVRGSDATAIPDEEWDRLKQALDSFIR
jgi:CsoR family transcriptional regulator, copper-sensing transcriptional repressor